MRVATQIAVVTGLGLVGYAGFQYWSTGSIREPVTGTVLYAGAPVTAAARGPQAPPPPIVETVAVATGKVIDIRESVGTVRANESISVASKLSGFIESIKFNEGQLVAAGQELVRLDAAERRADQETAVAQITQNQAQRDEIKQQLDRARRLIRSEAVAESRIDQLDSQLRSAESVIKGAEARLRAAQARLDDTIIRAPFAGRVGVRLVSVGAFLDTQTRITTLDDVLKIKLDFSLPENVLGQVSAGSTLRALTSAYPGRVFNGIVAVVDTRIDAVTRSVRFTALLDNADNALKPGMFMNVRVAAIERPEALLVPEEAIVGDGPRQIAFIVVDGKIERRLVQLGQREAGKIEIVSGLKAGEQIVVRGVQRIRAGQVVNARPLGTTLPPSTPTAGAPAAPVQSRT